MCELMRKDQDRQHLRKVLLEGAESAPAGHADAAYFDTLRDRVLLDRVLDQEIPRYAEALRRLSE